MTNLWLLAKICQPGRPLHAELTKEKRLSLDDTVLTHREVDDEIWAAPQWAHCMKYEFQLRYDAIRLCRQQGVSVSRTLCGPLIETRRTA